MSSFEPGQNLGRYKILRPLGMGAMGKVYLAEDPRIERLLAIKTVRLEGREGDVEERKQRLLREAKAAGRLVHPHVVTLFDAGEEGDTLFLAFEYVKGQDLSGRLEAGPPYTLSEALRVVRQAADGLGYAHQQGIVHRDIKPSNLLLDERGWVKISDFGIAKMAGQATELTMTGSVVGSPHYLSPEQIRGEDLDGRSDLFSLGVVLYELLSKKRPFEAETLTSLIYQILHQEPPSLEAGAGDATARLNAVVRKMMAKDKTERYQTAVEVVADLGAVEKALTSAQLSIPAATFLGPLPSAAPTAVTSGAGLPPGGMAPPDTARLTAGMPVASPHPPSPPTAATVLKGLPPPPLPPGAQARKSSPLGLVLGALALVVVAALGLGLFLLKRSGKPEVKPAEVAQQSTSPQTSPPGPGVRVIPQGTSEPTSDPTEEPAPATRLESSPSTVEERPATTTPTRPQPPPAKPPATTPAEPAPKPVTESPRTVEPRPSEPRPTEAEPREEDSEPTTSEPASPSPGRPKGKVVDTGMKLIFQGKDKVLEGWFLVIDGTNVGRALEWKERGGYELPEPGEHRVVLKKDGREQGMTINARRDLGPTPVFSALIAASTSSEGGGSGATIKVREAIGLRVEPRTARVVVDGQGLGLASEFSGGVGRWLRLDPGRHTVSLRADGYKPIDFVVEVTASAPQDKLRLPQFTLTRDGQ